MSFPNEKETDKDQSPEPDQTSHSETETTTSPSPDDTSSTAGEAEAATPTSTPNDETGTAASATAAGANTTATSDTAGSANTVGNVTAQYQTLDSDTDSTRSFMWVGYLVAILIVVLIILGVLYQLEKQGRSSTNVFDSLISSQEAQSVVATVNGEPITQRELSQSITQFGEAAQAQGVDTTNEESQAQLREQALTVLVNTELLRQAAVARDITISEEAATEQFETIRSDIGGPDALAERLSVLGLTEEELRAQIREELVIQELLDSLFLEAEVEVTEEEIQSTYQQAAAAGNELPPLEEVRPAIEEQLLAQKEQQVIDQFLAEQREAATIEGLPSSN